LVIVEQGAETYDCRRSKEKSAAWLIKQTVCRYAYELCRASPRPDLIWLIRCSQGPPQGEKILKAFVKNAANRSFAVLLLAVCSHMTPALAEPLACDDGIKTAFHPDVDTTVIAVRQIKKGEELAAQDVPKPPMVAAADLCLVKLLVGPGVTAEKDSTARSYSQGIGIEVWLPTQANWNERIRNYGGGGWVGGGHRYADKIGSKAPAIVNANMGYASATTDAGQPWYQDGSFTFLSDGKVNTEAFRDFSVRAMVEQAVKTKQLVTLYYGQPPKYTYYDGHSQGGRQGYKIVQDYPELYDGYMIAAPALSIPMFGTTALYPQIVMRTDLGYTAANKAEAAAFAAKVDAANKRAVTACDKAGLGFLLNPFQCDYDPARDAAALCAGVAGNSGSDRARQDLVRCHRRWQLRRRANSGQPRRQVARQGTIVVDLHQGHGDRHPDHQRLDG
jgi:feruloyl esterase